MLAIPQCSQRLFSNRVGRDEPEASSAVGLQERLRHDTHGVAGHEGFPAARRNPQTDVGQCGKLLHRDVTSVRLHVKRVPRTVLNDKFKVRVKCV